MAEGRAGGRGHMRGSQPGKLPRPRRRRRCTRERGCPLPRSGPRSCPPRTALAPLPVRSFETVILRTCVQVCAGISSESCNKKDTTGMFQLHLNLECSLLQLCKADLIIMYMEKSCVLCEKLRRTDSQLPRHGTPPAPVAQLASPLDAGWMDGGACLERMMMMCSHLQPNNGQITNFQCGK